jgi:hypothetical protein
LRFRHYIPTHIRDAALKGDKDEYDTVGEAYPRGVLYMLLSVKYVGAEFTDNNNCVFVIANNGLNGG